MSRHILDRSKPHDGSHRAEEFIRHERKDVPSAAAKALQRRPRTGTEQKRVEEFTRIERQS